MRDFEEHINGIKAVPNDPNIPARYAPSFKKKSAKIIRLFPAEDKKSPPASQPGEGSDCSVVRCFAANGLQFL